MNEIAQECIALIAKQKSIPPESITLRSVLVEDLGLDSLDRVSIAFDLEEKYEIEIPESQLDQIKTVQDMVSGIEQALAQKNSAAAPSSTA
ncbi:MAG TPA: acyl carrier protein [Acidobacteriaceae bacterium]|jgi:acyl carrier protein|nr:acyl carrier protein [Acidobacteriaceae bacterium]